MNKGKLTITVNGKKADLVRAYVNPADEPVRYLVRGNKYLEEDLRSKIKDISHKYSDADGRVFEHPYSAYDGMAFYFRNVSDDIRVELYDENGKEITRKTKHDDLCNHTDAMPLSFSEIDSMKESGIFGSKSISDKKKEALKEALRCSSNPSTPLQTIIAEVLSEAHGNSGLSSKNVFYKMFDSVERVTQTPKWSTFLAVDLYHLNGDVTFRTEFELEWEDKFDFEKLYYICGRATFLLYDLKVKALEEATLMNVVNYDGRLFFGKTQVLFDDDYFENMSAQELHESRTTAVRTNKIRDLEYPLVEYNKNPDNEKYYEQDCTPSIIVYNPRINRK